MGKGRDKRRRKTKHKVEVRMAKPHPPGGEPFDLIDPYAPVLAPLRPRPSLRSGTVALPEPERSELSFLDAIGIKF
jgi:hypothetical protein